jgi:hypothetical protein
MRDHLEDLVIDGRYVLQDRKGVRGHIRCSSLTLERENLLMDFKEIGCECVDWIELAQDRNQWRAVVSMLLMKFRVA